MRYLKYTYVDAVTGISSTDAPAANGPVSPLVVDLQFGFALESEYPTSTPVMFGTFLDGTPIDVPGVLSELTEAEYQAALDAELLARSVKTMASWASQIAARRFQVETGGVTVEGTEVRSLYGSGREKGGRRRKQDDTHAPAVPAPPPEERPFARGVGAALLAHRGGHATAFCRASTRSGSRWRATAPAG